jgi:hypothetical protein
VDSAALARVIISNRAQALVALERTTQLRTQVLLAVTQQTMLSELPSQHSVPPGQVVEVYLGVEEQQPRQGAPDLVPVVLGLHLQLQHLPLAAARLAQVGCLVAKTNQLLEDHQLPIHLVVHLQIPHLDPQVLEHLGHHSPPL